MKYDNDYIKMLYEEHNLTEFLSKINVEHLADNRMKAIISALKRSIVVLNLEFNPVEQTISQIDQEHKQPQKP